MKILVKVFYVGGDSEKKKNPLVDLTMENKFFISDPEYKLTLDGDSYAIKAEDFEKLQGIKYSGEVNIEVKELLSEIVDENKRLKASYERVYKTNREFGLKDALLQEEIEGIKKQLERFKELERLRKDQLGEL